MHHHRKQRTFQCCPLDSLCTKYVAHLSTNWCLSKITLSYWRYHSQHSSRRHIRHIGSRERTREWFQTHLLTVHKDGGYVSSSKWGQNISITPGGGWQFRSEVSACNVINTGHGSNKRGSYHPENDIIQDGGPQDMLASLSLYMHPNM